jgi:ankyrin repeat protein
MRKYILKYVILYLIFFLLTIITGCRFIIREKSIHRAAYKGDLKKVKKIIERDPNQINIKDALGTTPLYLASMQGHTEVVEFLIVHGANIELGNDLGERPLAKAAKFGHYETLKTLLEHGATVNCKDKYGQTPLHEAARHSGKEVINLLLLYGADVDAKDEDNNTPLHDAAERNNIEAAKALVEHGADILAKNYFDYRKPAENQYVIPPRELTNKTPKEIALQRGFHELARYLQTKEEEK